MAQAATKQAKDAMRPPLDPALLVPCAEPVLAVDDKLETVLRAHAQNGKAWRDCRKDKQSLTEYVNRYLSRPLE